MTEAGLRLSPSHGPGVADSGELVSSGPSPSEARRTVESVPDSTSAGSLWWPHWLGGCTAWQPVVELHEPSRVHSWGQSVIRLSLSLSMSVSSQAVPQSWTLRRDRCFSSLDQDFRDRDFSSWRRLRWT